MLKCLDIKQNINETKNKKLIEKVNKLIIWFFEMINTTGKSIAGVHKKKIIPLHINDIRKKRDAVTTDLIDIKKVIKKYYELLYVHNLIAKMNCTSFLTRTVYQNSHRSNRLFIIE